MYDVWREGRVSLDENENGCAMQTGMEGMMGRFWRRGAGCGTDEKWSGGSVLKGYRAVGKLGEGGEDESRSLVRSAVMMGVEGISISSYHTLSNYQKERTSRQSNL